MPIIDPSPQGAYSRNLVMAFLNALIAGTKESFSHGVTLTTSLSGQHVGQEQPLSPSSPWMSTLCRVYLLPPLVGRREDGSVRDSASTQLRDNS